jgi:tetratricopeptide (TPR) repeat protein
VSTRRRTAIALFLGAFLLSGDAVAAPRDRGSGSCTGLEPAVRSGAEALDRGQWADAGRLLEPLAASHQDCSGVLLGLARLRAARGDHAGAESLFARATALAPEDAIAHALFAQYWLSRDQPARADYQSALALSLNPDCPEALVVKGRLLGLKGQPQEARQALEEAARLDPANAEAHYRLGAWSFRQKRHAEAAAHFEKAVAVRPVDALAHDYLALCLEAIGESERAERAYRSGLEVNEGPFFDSLLDYNYGRFLLKQGRLEESRSRLDRAVALLPDRRGVYYERAKLKLALKDYQAAREDAERALSLREPGGLVLDLQVYYLLATVYARLGETELARKYAELARTTPIPDQQRDRR